MMRAVLLAGLMLGPMPALAEVKLWPRDSACEPVLTVQSRVCTVINYFRCPYEGGYTYRLEVEMPEDYEDTSASLLTSGGDLIAYGDPSGNWQGHVVAPRNPPTDLAALKSGDSESYVETGMDLVDGEMVEVRTRSVFRLVSDEVEIDGQKLRQINVIMHDIFLTGQSEYPTVDTIYYSPALGIPILGETGGFDSDGPYSDETRPVDIILPGQPGFGSTIPKHDCGDLSMISAPLPEGAA